MVTYIDNHAFKIIELQKLGDSPLFQDNLGYISIVASFPGPAQLSVACSTNLKVTESWVGPGNEAISIAQYVTLHLTL